MPNAGLNRLTETTLHDGADTVYAYNNRGNLASITDPTNNVTSYTYDYLHRLKTEAVTLNSVPRTKSYWYDAVGQMIKKEDRLGQITRYDFDNLGRVYQERWKTDTGTTVRTIGYQFDNLGRLTGVSEVDGSSTAVGADYDYTYDNLGRVTQTVHDIVGLTPDVTFAQTFNALGNRTQLAATIGATADFVNDYSYDALGRMARVTQQSQSGGNAVADKRVDFGYNPAGQFSQIRRYADLLENEYVARTDFDYDATGRLTDLTHTGGGLATPIDYALTYDDHRLNTVTYGGKTLDYAYDTVDQLTTVDYTGTGTPTDESYSHDDSGNRTNTGYTTGDHNRLTADGTYTYQYDHNGNRTTRTKVSDGTLTEYGWDHRNRLTSVTFKTSGGTVTKAVQYEYDAYNRLVTKKLDADGNGTFEEKLHWIYDGNQAVLQFDGDTAADLSHRYLWGPAVDQLLADETVDNGGAEDVLWTLGDWQGSVRHLASYNAATDTTTIENQKFYDAYGNVTAETNSAVDTLFAYTGRMFDDDTGLQNNHNRWYDPVVGRFVSPDPIGFEGLDPNLYRYVGNSPADSVDPSGLQQIGVGIPMGDALTTFVEDVRAVPVPGSRNDMPDVLPGRWRVTICAYGEDWRDKPGHAWIIYEEIGKDSRPTGVMHSAGCYAAGYGRTDTGEAVSSPGAQWKWKKDEDSWKQGKATYTRSVIIEDPKPLEMIGYWGPQRNCATYARDAWCHHTGEYLHFPPHDPIGWPRYLGDEIYEANKPSLWERFKAEMNYGMDWRNWYNHMR